MITADLTRVQVWVASTPIDMRKSFDGLAEIVRSFLGHDPLSGHMFVFRDKSGYLIKVLWWDHEGLAIYYKRLERGVFPFPATSHTVSVPPTAPSHFQAICHADGLFSSRGFHGGQRGV